ncbi:MAG: zinc-ribbon domain-containing protein [Pirellulaceae bacterium]
MDCFQDDDFQDDEFYDDVIDDSYSEVVVCPECGDDVYEDAEQCPLCGAYIVHQYSPWSKRPLWWVVLGLLGVISVIITLFWGF